MCDVTYRNVDLLPVDAVECILNCTNSTECTAAIAYSTHIFLLGIGFNGCGNGAAFRVWQCIQWLGIGTAQRHICENVCVYGSCLLLHCDPTMIKLSHSRHFIALWWKKCPNQSGASISIFFSLLLPPLLLMLPAKVFIKYSELGNKERILLSLSPPSFRVIRRLNLSGTCNDWQIACFPLAEMKSLCGER